ncbi:MAG: ATP-binding protein [Rhodobacteraceae bacterium]|nr:ATP-binding protein [Paracoccaceae bacterium]MCW9041712.1 ATP-binding protein [Pseudopelagicola sp.]
MTDQIEPIKTIAPLRNVRAMVTLLERLQNRTYGLPGMATYYGFSGYGKSTAAIYAINQFGACYVEVRETWTTKFLLETILRELGVAPKGRPSIARMAEQVAKELAIRDIPLLIDEADILVRKNMIEVVRGLHEDSQAPVLLIGEEQMPQKLQQWERVHGRMLDYVAAQPACMDDLNHLAQIYAPEVDLDEAFRKRLLVESHHSLRRLVVNLAKVQELAMTHDFTVINLDNWRDRAFQAIAAPAPRRNLA